jgi:RNA polymerase sigma-70 factor (ECF subfamily)
VFRRARALLRDPDRARDATQEVFLRAARDPGRMGAEPLRWLFRVTTNLCLNNIRDSRRHGRLLASYPFESNRECGVESCLAVSELLARVPTELRQIAIAYYVDDLSHEEIAVTLGISRRTVGNRLAAFQTLAAELFGQHGGPT